MEEKFLEAHKYPEITFTATRVEGHIAPAGDSKVQVRGVFGLHGQQHEITVPAMVHIDGDQLSTTMHFEVPYQQWGVKNPSTFILRVSDKVQIDLHATGHLVPRVTS
jgi:polyisoprenoid-binding protein YceI